MEDTKPGDIKGEGLQAFGGGWDLVSPAGKKIGVLWCTSALWYYNGYQLPHV